jgi:hypothetical protein
MRKTTLLAIVGVTLAVLLATVVPKVQADVEISIGIPIPGITFYAPGPPPPVYYSAPPYYPRAYDAPPAYYWPSYSAAYYGRGYGAGWGHRGYSGGHHRGHGCRHRNHW